MEVSCGEVFTKGQSDFHSNNPTVVSQSATYLVFDCRTINNFSSLSTTKHKTNGSLRIYFHLHGEDNLTDYINTVRDIMLDCDADDMFDRYNLSLAKIIAVACKDSLQNPPVHKIVWTTHGQSRTAPTFNGGNSLNVVHPSNIPVTKLTSLVLIDQNSTSFLFAAVFDNQHFFQSHIDIPFNSSQNPNTFFVTLNLMSQLNFVEDLQLAENSGGTIRIAMKCGDTSGYSVCIFNYDQTSTRSPINYFRLPNNNLIASQNYSFQFAGRRVGLEAHTICVRFQDKIYFWNWHSTPYTNYPFHEFPIPSSTQKFKSMRLSDYVVALIENTKIEVRNLLDPNQTIFKLDNIDYSTGEVSDFCWGKESNQHNHFLVTRRVGNDIHTQILAQPYTTQGIFSENNTIVACLTGSLLSGSTCNSSNCPSGQGNMLQRCVICPPYCTGCHFNPTWVCTGCVTNYTLINGLCTNLPTCDPASNCPTNQCEQGNTSRCLYCNIGNYLKIDDRKCVNPCPSQGYYPTNQIVPPGSTQIPVCDLCDSTCSTCNGPNANSCTSCPPGSYFDDNSAWLTSFPQSTCSLSCDPIKKITPDDFRCRDRCDATCHTCNGVQQDQCILCPANKRRLQGPSSIQCLDQCPDFFGTDLIGGEIAPGFYDCVACISPYCKKCQLNSNICTSCVTGYELLFNNCFSVCATGKYNQFNSAPPTNPVCEDCDKSCKECKTTSTFCTECKQVPNSINDPITPVAGVCNYVCQPNYFLDYVGLTPTCLSCISLCQVCFNDYSCDTCQPGIYFHIHSTTLKKTCHNLCPDGTYLDGQQCKDCDPSCLKCSGAGSQQCTSCKTLEFFHPSPTDNSTDGFCRLSKCDDTFFVAQTTSFRICHRCDSSCFNCSGAGSQQCTSCKAGKFFHPSPADSSTEGFCQPTQCDSKFFQAEFTPIAVCHRCDSRCLTCSGSKYNCLSCDSSTRDLQNNWCELKCNIGTYYVMQPGYGAENCPQCNQHCESCDQTSTHCLSCTSSYTFLDYRNYCKLNCPVGQAWVETNECFPCKENCASCSEISFLCNLCKDGFRLSLVDSKRCVKIYIEYLEVTKTQVDRVKQTLSIQFRFEIEDLKKFENQFDVDITNGDGSKPSFKVLTITKNGPREIQVQFDFESSLVNAEIKILDKSALIKSREMKLPLKTGEGGVLPEEERSQGRLLLEDKTIKVSGVTLSADKNDKRIRNLEVPVKATVGAVTGAMLLLSPGSGMGMLKIIQYYEYLRYINVKDIPENFIEFLNLFSQNVFDFAPNPFETDETDPEKISEAKKLEEEKANADKLQNGDSSRRELQSDPTSEEMLPNFSYCKMNQHLVEIEQPCFFLNNSGNHLLQILIYFLVKALVRLLKVMSTPKEKLNPEDIQTPPSLLHTITAKLDILMGLPFFVNLFMAMHLDLILSALINVFSFWVSPLRYLVNSLAASAVVVLYLAFIFYVTRHSMRLEKKRQELREMKNRIRELDKAGKDSKALTKEWKDQKKLKDDWRFLKENVQKSGDRSFFGGIIDQIIVVKDFLVAVCIILLMKNPYWQLIPTIIIYIAFIILVIRYRAFSSKLYFATLMINEIVYTFVLCCYFTFNATKHNMTPDQRRAYFGYGLIVVCGLNILYNLCVGFYELFVAIKSCCTRKKEDINTLADMKGNKIRAKERSQSDESLLNLNPDSPVRKRKINRVQIQQAQQNPKNDISGKKKVKEEVEKSVKQDPLNPNIAKKNAGKNRLSKPKKNVNFQLNPFAEDISNKAANNNSQSENSLAQGGLIKFRTLKTKNLWSAETQEKIDFERNAEHKVSINIKPALKMRKSAQGASDKMKSKLN